MEADNQMERSTIKKKTSTVKISVSRGHTIFSKLLRILKTVTYSPITTLEFTQNGSEGKIAYDGCWGPAPLQGTRIGVRNLYEFVEIGPVANVLRTRSRGTVSGLEERSMTTFSVGSYLLGLHALNLRNQKLSQQYRCDQMLPVRFFLDFETQMYIICRLQSPMHKRRPS